MSASRALRKATRQRFDAPYEYEALVPILCTSIGTQVRVHYEMADARYLDCYPPPRWQDGRLWDGLRHASYQQRRGASASTPFNTEFGAQSTEYELLQLHITYRID